MEPITVLINGEDVRDRFPDVTMVAYRGPVAPGIKNDGINTPGSHGLYNSYSPFAATQLEIDMLFVGDSGNEVNDLLREFTTTIGAQQQLQFVFSDDTNVYRLGKYKSSGTYQAVHAINNWYIRATFVFIQADPFKYARETIVYETVLEGGQSFTFNNPGFETPYKVTFSISATGYILDSLLNTVALGMTTYLNYLAQSGTYFVTINNPGERFYSEFGWLTPIGIGDEITIDGEAYQVFLNNQLSLTSWIGFISLLQSGDNTISLNTPEGYNMNVRIEFRPRYL